MTESKEELITKFEKLSKKNLDELMKAWWDEFIFGKGAYKINEDGEVRHVPLFNGCECDDVPSDG